MTHDENEPLFRNALAAVRWAISEDRVALQRSSLYASPGKGMGLSGFDGAAQAGLILGHVKALKVHERAVVIGQAAAVKLPCACRRDCCSGWKSNPIWMDAVQEASAWWIETHADDCRRPRLVIACMRRYFGEHVTLEVIAQRNGICRKTAGEANGAVVRVLRAIKEGAWGALESSLGTAALIETSVKNAA